eukprot:1035641-Prorocentrum_minimum.AAC.1
MSSQPAYFESMGHALFPDWPTCSPRPAFSGRPVHQEPLHRALVLALCQLDAGGILLDGHVATRVLPHFVDSSASPRVGTPSRPCCNSL